jgi:hypothetical protein
MTLGPGAGPKKKKISEIFYPVVAITTCEECFFPAELDGGFFFRKYSIRRARRARGRGGSGEAEGVREAQSEHSGTGMIAHHKDSGA